MNAEWKTEKYSGVFIRNLLYDEKKVHVDWWENWLIVIYTALHAIVAMVKPAVSDEIEYFYEKHSFHCLEIPVSRIMINHHSVPCIPMVIQYASFCTILPRAVSSQV